MAHFTTVTRALAASLPRARHVFGIGERDGGLQQRNQDFLEAVPRQGPKSIYRQNFVSIHISSALFWE